MSSDASYSGDVAVVPAIDAAASARLFADTLYMRDNSSNDGTTSSASGSYKYEISANPSPSSDDILPSLTIDFSGSHVADDVEKSIAAAEETAARNTVEVKKGDCVWDIAERELQERLGHKPSNREILELTKQIAEFNNLKNGNYIVPGQKIQIPQPN